MTAFPVTKLPPPERANTLWALDDYNGKKLMEEIHPKREKEELNTEI